MKNQLPLLISTFSVAIGSTCAFVPAHTPSIGGTTASKSNSNNNRRDTSSSTSIVHREINNNDYLTTALFATSGDDKKAKKAKAGGLDETMRNKLVTESIAPWRTLRLFLYGSFGTGAFIGGLVNGSGAIAASNSPDFNIQTELVNLGIDFGVVFLMGFLAKWDLDRREELQGKVDERIERKKEMKVVSKAMKGREATLQGLPLEITIGNDGNTRRAYVADLQKGAKQHMIIVAGPKKACRDALIGANLMKMDFAMSNVLVVPYETDSKSDSDSSTDNKLSGPSGGFGDRPSYEKQAFIARPTGEDWDEYIEQEIDDAVQQNGLGVKRDGIAIVVANDGSIIRRGVGTVPWRQMVEQLEETVNPTPDGKKGPLPWMDL